MSTRTTEIPKRFHDAVLRWRQLFLPDYDYLMENWERFFPREPRFELCAYRENGMCTEIECGDEQGKAKYTRACDIRSAAAQALLAGARRHASTACGSVPAH